MPIKNGEQFLRSINRLKPSVIYKGEYVTGNLSEHFAFSGLLSMQASLYDMQGEENYMDKMTYLSPHSSEPVGLSFIFPKTKNDLRRRRTMTSLWASRHHGFLGRAPDYMNIALAAYASAADVLQPFNPEFADNLKNYYVYCREHDISLSHAFVQPAGTRLSAVTDSFEDSIAAKVHEFNSDGMIVSGAFLLATRAVTSEEILIYPPPVLTLEEENPFTFAFAIPIDSPGLTLVCRESYVQGDSAYDFPLSSQFEEMDTLVLCDHVKVPRDRIFLYGSAQAANELAYESQFHAQVSHQTISRYIAKTEFFLGTAENLARLADADSDILNQHISDIIVILEILKSLLLKAEVKAKKNRWGVIVPDKGATLVANTYFPKIYPRMVEIIQHLASSRLVMIPSEKDFESEVSLDLKKYLQISDTEAHKVIALNRLAWELSASSFAGRQVQYERFFFGNPQHVTNRLYQGFIGREKLIKNVTRFLNL
ncbi:4-hydroxyphenylacetate 3-hydroxylase N-terminal domain-containing protein [Paenibacillus sp. GCM10012307]|uniref:4-hydroxyphenylacetate 3-monooxygenase, oxygenase component n=1 Tax=Paenibacillus roseus TaxID=2798579 RepID=A0A934J6E0_9BACL|nr:4-hydroxyphenylacetate 3-hydroxylase N-terminal domain-containing protein [Paenibacillus roseus]MBJ6361220.1 4-hydroxyphenylacetate 3-monooxygenase, oxygenase component [Paenibacillus roseus]